MNKIIDLKDIEYLESQINKNLIFDNDQSSITLLSLKKGAKRALHTDKEDEVIIIIEGRTLITIEKENFELKENQMIVMPKTKLHGSEAITDSKMLLIRPKHTHEKSE